MCSDIPSPPSFPAAQTLRSSYAERGEKGKKSSPAVNAFGVKANGNTSAELTPVLGVSTWSSASSVPKDRHMDSLSTVMGEADLNGNTPLPSLDDAVFAAIAIHESGDTLQFYEAEGQVLALWDQLNDIKLEQALHRVQAISLSGAHTL